MKIENEKLLLDLIKINSESSNEKQIGNFIYNILKQYGFKVKKQIVNKKLGNFNIFAYKGDPKIIFSNHIDTVRGQLEVKETASKIYGRGACDTKSQVAAAILAAKKALDSGLSDFGVLFTVQEEVDFLGAEKAVDLIPDNRKLIIIGEPTNLSVISGHNGILAFELIAKGKPAHGSMPEKGINAIELLIDDLNKPRKANFGKSKALGNNIINIAKISGGTAENVVPDHATATIAFRTVINSDELIKKIKLLVKSEVKIIFNFEPIFNNFAKKLAEIIKTNVKTVRYFTEASILSKKGEVIVLGAGSIEEAHGQNEFVSKKEFNNLIDMYFNIIKYYSN